MLLSRSVDAMSDEELVELAQSGDLSAMESIILRYRSFVAACTFGYFAKGFDRDDIFQEGMIGLYNAVLDYKHEKSAFKSFALLCVSRKIISLVKSSGRQKNIPLNSSISLDSTVCNGGDTYLVDVLKASDSSNPELIFINKEEYDGYRRRINRLLSPFEKQVLLCQLDKMSYKAISERLGKDIKAIDNAVQRIRKKLERVDS